MRLVTSFLIACCVVQLTTAVEIKADDNYLVDRNGDEQVSALAFGDSLTFGVGDGSTPGTFVESPPPSDGLHGYPLRLSTLLGLPVANAGDPGEELALGGVERFPQANGALPSDFTIILEGTNDAVHKLANSEFELNLQKIINVAFAQGSKPLLVTIPQPCCNHAGPALFTASYSQSVRNIAAINQVDFADLERAWKTTCQNPEECELYNIPEGLHPNSVGYDVIAQTIAATLLGIDVFGENGAQELESALSLEKGSVIVKPDL